LLPRVHAERRSISGRIQGDRPKNKRSKQMSAFLQAANFFTAVHSGKRFPSRLPAYWHALCDIGCAIEFNSSPNALPSTVALMVDGWI
jgi:hypothetical protein